MKVYKIRRKDNPDDYVSGYFESIKGVKAAINNRASWISRTNQKDNLEVVEYDVTEVKVTSFDEL